MMELLVRTIPATPCPLHHLRRTRPRATLVCRAQSRPAAGGSKKKAARIVPELMPNARRRKQEPLWDGGGFSLGVDLGNIRTGVALGKGLGLPHPLTVLRMNGQELEIKLVELASKEYADELVVGLPTSLDGTETAQSTKVRAFVRKLAVRAADKGLRVYLQNEHGTSKDAMDYMIDMGVRKSARRVQSDAYSAVMVLERYFEMSGIGVELVLPTQPELRKKLRTQVRSQEDVLWKDEDGSGGNYFGLF